MPTEDSSELEVECGCDYPHGQDFEPPFETCTCKSDCRHTVPIYPPEPDEEDEGQLLGIDR